MKKLTIGLAALAFVTTGTSAQNGRIRPFEIADNSLLVEEAFNQEAGVFQNIFLFQVPRSGGGWNLEFTQEWPLGGQRHQLSFTLPIALDEFEVGNLVLNYRVQAWSEAAGPAVSPRLSLIVPTGEDQGFQWGVQLNLPASKQFGDLYVHANAGTTLTREEVAPGEASSLVSPQVAGSVIWRARPMLHLLVETVARFEETRAAICCATGRESTLVIAPGFRAARNLGTHQVVVGAAVPVTAAGPEGGTRLLLYLSYELPFKASR